MDQLLDRVALVEDPSAAVDLVDLGQGITAVTPDGDVFAPGFVRGGSASAPSLIEIQAAVDETQDKVQDAVRRGEQAKFALATATERVAAANDAVEAALERLHESDARMAGVAERLGRLADAVRAARGEAERIEAAIAGAATALGRDRGEYLALSQRLAEARAEPGEREPSHEERGPPRARCHAGPRRRDRATPDATHPRGTGPRHVGAGRVPGGPLSLSSQPASGPRRRERRSARPRWRTPVHSGATYAVQG